MGQKRNLLEGGIRDQSAFKSKEIHQVDGFAGNDALGAALEGVVAI